MLGRPDLIRWAVKAWAFPGERESECKIDSGEGESVGWLWRWRGPCGKEVQQSLITENKLLPTASKKIGISYSPQSYICKEGNSTNNLDELGNRSFSSQDEFAAWPVPRLWPGETLRRETSHIKPDCWPTELWANKRVWFKPLDLWSFVT